MLTNNDYRAATYQVFKCARHPISTSCGMLPGMTVAEAFEYARVCVQPLPEDPVAANVRHAANEFYAVRAIGDPVRTARQLWRDCYSLQRAGELS